MLENTATTKCFEYSPSGKELKTQTDIADKLYQGLDKIYQFNETIKKKPTLKKRNKLALIYNNKYSFYKYYRDSKKIENLSLESKYSFLAKHYNDLDKFSKLKLQKQKTRKKKTNIYDTSSELYNDLL